MKERAGHIDFSLWPKTDAPTDGGLVLPWLDLEGEDEPINFLFTYTDGKGKEHGLIAGANLHTLQGKKKTGKSAWGLALITASLKGEYIGIKPTRENLKILWIDTEQDKKTLRQKARAVLSMADLNTMPENVKILALSGYGSPAECLTATLQAITETNADFVFLDGVVDICGDFNDEVKSSEVVLKIKNLAEQYGSAILGVIHTNKRDDEARGHLGAIIQQKSAEIYQVNKDGQTAQVSQPFSRFAPVPDIYFVFADDFKIVPPAGDKGTERRRTLERDFVPLFHDATRLTASELTEAYMKYHNTRKRKAQNEIKFAVIAGVLEKEEIGVYVYYSLPFSGINLDDDEDKL